MGISIRYITIKKINDYENIYSVNPLYLIIGKIDGLIEEKNGSRYLVFDSTDGSKELLKKNTIISDGIKQEIETKNGGREGEHGKNSMKIEFHSDDDLSLNKPLKFLTMTIIVRSLFKGDGKFYRQIYLDECLYEL